MLLFCVGICVAIGITIVVMRPLPASRRHTVCESLPHSESVPEPLEPVRVDVEHYRATVYDASHPVADGALLSLIAGQWSFSGKSSDACNMYFFIVASIVGLVPLGLAVMVIIFICYVVVITVHHVATAPSRTGAGTFTRMQ